MSAGAFSKLCFWLALPALVFSARSQTQETRPSSSASQQSPPQPQAAQSEYVLKVTTRLVTVDLIATDSRGNPVRDLKPDEVQIFEEHKHREKIEHFQFFEKLKTSESAASPQPEGVLSNQFAVDRLKIPPVAVLMDSLNTQSSNQLQSRARMIQLLRTLPADTPVAVFLLGSSLHILQGFTTDPGLLRAALNGASAGNMIVKDPVLDNQSESNYLLDQFAGTANATLTAVQIGEVQNFEKEEYGASVDLRAKETLGALAQIGQYLSGIPGRKILIWASESFPISIAPDPDTGYSSFAGGREYSEQVRNVANSLTDAQVAVYPMDVMGVRTQQALAASQNVSRPTTRMTGPDIAKQLTEEDIDIDQSHGTMQELAHDTGGKACSSNDLAGCVSTALKDSSTYYELSFYPQNAAWDGRFHKITLKTTRPGVKLSYRRGFYALDASALAKKQPPEEHLHQACADQLPSTSIALTVQRVTGGAPAEPSGALQYSVIIAAAGLGSLQDNGSYSLNVRLADCELTKKDTVFRFHENEMPKTVPTETYKSWVKTGIPYRASFMPSADTRRIRLVVLDVSSGLTGAIDIPVRASDLAKAAPPAEPPAPIVTTPYVELPDQVKGSVAQKVVASVTFHLGASASATLDWSGDAVKYQANGEMPLAKSAGGFASYAFSSRFHCEGGHFVPADPSDPAPALRFTFHNNSGRQVVVDLKGDQPLYLGDLPIDPTAQSLFDEVWKSAHCQQ